MRKQLLSLFVILLLLTSCSANGETPTSKNPEAIPPETQSTTDTPNSDDTEETHTNTDTEATLPEDQSSTDTPEIADLKEKRTYTDLEATLLEPQSTKDIPYIDDGDVRHKLDVHLPPTGEGSYPVILAIHGGGFVSRSKNLYRDLAPIYNDMGFALVATNYRYITTTSYPGQVEDAACALAWIHSEGPNYNLDPTRVIIMGGSAGGYMASMLATHDDLNSFLGDCPHTLPSDDTHLGAVIFYGLTNFTNPTLLKDNNRSIREKLWGESQEEISQERLAEMSPITWIDSNDKPFLMLHGTRDYDIPVEMTYEFVEALETAGVRVETYYPYLSHAFEIGSLTKEDILTSFLKIDVFVNSLIE